MVSTPLNNLVKLDHFPRVRGENKKCLKPPPREVLNLNKAIGEDSSILGT